MKLINIYDNLYVKMDKAKPTKYYKRVPKPTGKGYIYYYTKDQYDKSKEKEKPEKKSKKEGKKRSGIVGAWEALSDFFGITNETKFRAKIQETYSENKDKLQGVDISTFTYHMNEYLTNKDKWDKKLQGKEKVIGKDKKDRKIVKKPAKDKAKASGKKWDMSLMRKVAGIVGGVKVDEQIKTKKDEFSKDGKLLDEKSGRPFEVFNQTTANLIVKKYKQQGIELKAERDRTRNYSFSKEESGDKNAVMSDEVEWTHPDLKMIGNRKTVIKQLETDQAKNGKLVFEQLESKIKEAKDYVKKYESMNEAGKNRYKNIYNQFKDVVEIYEKFKSKYKEQPTTEVMSEENFINMKSSQKYINDMMEFHNKDKAIGYIKKLIDIIKNKDYNELVELLHSGNKSSRKMFEESTGLKLGNNKNSTKETLKKYVGEENFKKGEKEIQEKKEKYEKEKQLKKEKSDKESQIKDLEKKIKYDNEVMTTKEFIDKNIKEGTEYKEVKRGINTVGQLWNGNSYVELKSKSEKNYAKENLNDKEPEKLKKKESAKGNQAKYDQAKQDITKFEDLNYKDDYDTESDWIKEMEAEEKSVKESLDEDVEDGKLTRKQANEEMKNSDYNVYLKNKKELKALKEKLLGPKMFKAKIIKKGNKYYKLNKGKKVPIGTVSNGRKKVAEGEWVPDTDGKSKKPDDKKPKPGGKKDDKKQSKDAAKQDAKERLTNTLKKIANILADALSGKDVVQPGGQAVEEIGDNSKRNKSIKSKEENKKRKPKDEKPKKPKKE